MLSTETVRNEVADFFKRNPTGNSAADAFAAWWLHRRFKQAPADAVVRAPGGSYDFGVDGYHIEGCKDGPLVVHIIQAKYSQNRKLIKQAVEDFARSAAQLRTVFSGSISEAPTLNSLFSRLAADFQNCILASGKEEEVELRFEVIHLSEEPPEILYESLKGAQEKFQNAVKNHFPNHSCSLRLVFPPEELHGGIVVVPAERHEIGFQGTPVSSEGNFTFYSGFGYLADLVDLYHKRGDALFSKNIRMYLFNAAEKGPAKYIRDSIRSCCIPSTGRLKWCPEQFATLHNGVTIAAEHAEVPADGRLSLRAPNVLNGCQTIKTSYLFVNDLNVRDKVDQEAWRRVRISLRVLVSHDENLVRNVTISNNRQNAIRVSAFRANDAEQLELSERFKVEGIFYERQDQAFVNFQRSNPAQFYEDYPNSPQRPITMEDLAQAIAAVSSKPALSVAAKVALLFEDPTYGQVFSPSKLANIGLLVFLRNLLQTAPLVAKDLRLKSKALSHLPVSGFRLPLVRILARYAVSRRPALVSQYGSSVLGTVGPSHHLRQELVKLCSASHTKLQQRLPDSWVDASGVWKNGTDAEATDGVLGELGLDGFDVFSASKSLAS